MKERRRRPRNASPASAELHVAVENLDGSIKAREARLVDSSEWGIGFEIATPMTAGSTIFAWGPALPGAPDVEHRRSLQVMHCRMSGENLYRAGCAFAEAPPFEQNGHSSAAPDPTLEDYYEALQISPNADQETIHRVYRLLAQRYHPDNPDTGNSNAFQVILRAHQTLSDSVKRASYDAKYQANRQLRWKIFETPASSEGLEAEKRKRAGVLGALYNKRAETPDDGGMYLRDLENLLGVPREHLQFTVWYLRRKGLIEGPNNGRYEITVDGTDAAERFQEEGLGPRPLGPERRIEAGSMTPCGVSR